MLDPMLVTARATAAEAQIADSALQLPARCRVVLGGLEASAASPERGNLCVSPRRSH
jgi:hypothetical protein